jgi:hypothetical protein
MNRQDFLGKNKGNKIATAHVDNKETGDCQAIFDEHETSEDKKAINLIRLQSKKQGKEISRKQAKAIYVKSKEQVAPGQIYVNDSSVPISLIGEEVTILRSGETKVLK